MERHHVLSSTSARKERCEYYGYIAPLRPDLHPNGARFQRSQEMDYICKAYDTPSIDHYLKSECQRHFEENHGSREVWMSLFYKNYLWGAYERV